MKKIILTILFLILIQQAAFAEKENMLTPFDLNNKFISAITFEALTNNSLKTNKTNENFSEDFQKATSRYMQTNVVAAYKDFSKIINTLDKNDFLYISVAQRLDSFGFFSLGQIALINIEDEELWHISEAFMKKLYNPTVTLSYDEEIYLAELLTSTLYNNSAEETIKNLENNEKLLKKSDYANYVLAVAYFENKNYPKALNAINKALNKSPECIKYLYFKEKIYSQAGEYKNALKIIDDIAKSGYNYDNFMPILENDRLYIKMKMSKKDRAKYYSAKLLFNTGDCVNGLKEVQNAISLNKKNYEALTLLGDYYINISQEDKAKEEYEKALKIKPKYADAVFGMGKYYYATKNYNSSLEYYMKALKLSPNNEQFLLYAANNLTIADDNENAINYLKKALKINPNSSKAYYLMSKLVPDMKEQYLRTAISLNPANAHAWLDLAELKISQNDYKTAKEYLLSVKLLEEVSDNPKYKYLKNLVDTNSTINPKSSYNMDYEIQNPF